MMLGGMIITGQTVLTANGLPGVPTGPADYVVTNDAEWDTVFANSAAMLSRKTVEIVGSNFTTRTIANRDMWAAGGRLTLRSRDAAARIPALSLSGTVRGIDFSAFNIQVTGWPANALGCVNLLAGTYGKLRFLNGTTFRHGYGAGLANIDTAAELPEYARVNNVRTATTTSQTFPLSWQNAAMTEGWIEFFNRGTNPVRVAVGGSGVVATGSSTLIAAGTRGRISGLNPTTATHFAVLATTGTSEVNARTEIGLAAYLAQGFFATGGVTVEDLEFRNVLFRDLSNGIKGFPNCQSLIAMDCDFDRIYQDLYSFGLQTGGSAHIYRSIECIPFCRSGIAENQSGDARDPHGDHLQMFSSGGGSMGPIYYSGNRIRRGNLRSGAGSQGVLLSDNDFTPSYDGVFMISTMQVGGAPIGIYIGESGFPVRNVMVYGASVVDAVNPASTQPNFTIVPDTSNTIYVGSVLSPNITEFGPTFLQENNLLLTPANAAAVFPNIAGLSTATTRAQIEAAMTTEGAGAGRGAIAAGNAIDWTTSDHTAVILWQNVPSGAVWADPGSVEPNTMTALPLRKILNRRANQPVSVGAGTEWRSVGTDGTTEVQAWTSALGAIQPDQFIQMRRMSGAVGEALVASITINGFTETATVRAGVVAPAVSLLRPATAAFFQSPTNIPAATTRIQMRGLFRFASLPASASEIMSGLSNPVSVLLYNNGRLDARIEDSAGTVVFEATLTPAGTIAINNWYDIEIDANHLTNQVRITVNGTDFTGTFTAEGTNVFPTNRAMTFLAGSAGANIVPVGTRAADMRVWYNGTLAKTIPNDAAAANLDAWKLGVGVFTNA